MCARAQQFILRPSVYLPDPLLVLPRAAVGRANMAGAGRKQAASVGRRWWRAGPVAACGSSSGTLVHGDLDRCRALVTSSGVDVVFVLFW